MQKTILLTTVLGLTIFANAQQCNCDKVLVQDYLEANYNEDVALHYLNTVDASTYSKKETKSVLSASFPIEGVPVGGELSWNDFNEYRSRLFAEKKFDFEKEQSYQTIKRAFSEATLSAFNKCITACGSSEGTFAYLESLNDDVVNIVYDYKSPGSLDKVKITKIVKRNLNFLDARDSISMLQSSFPSGTHKEVKLKRVNEHEFSTIQISFKRNATVKDITISIHPLPILKKYKKIRLQGNDHGDRFNFTNANLIVGAAIGDPETPAGLIHPNTVSSNPHSGFRFGPWANPDCQTSGNGWYYLTQGTCGVRPELRGIAPKGLAWVELWVEDK